MILGPSEHQSGLTPTDFDRLVRQSSLPTLVSFENPWSKALIPGLDELAIAFRGRLRLVRVNMATHPDLAARLKIRVVPTLLFFNRGALVEFMVGPVPIQFIVQMVANTHLQRRHLLQGTHRSRGRKPAHRALSSRSPDKPFGALVG
jgi:thioredoxin-like negative regulator of GroEL